MQIEYMKKMTEGYYYPLNNQGNGLKNYMKEKDWPNITVIYTI